MFVAKCSDFWVCVLPLKEARTQSLYFSEKVRKSFSSNPQLKKFSIQGHTDACAQTLISVLYATPTSDISLQQSLRYNPQCLSFASSHNPIFSWNMHTNHSSCCSLFIHSFIHVAGFMFGLVQHHSSAHSLPHCHPLRGLVDRKSTTLIVQHSGFIQTKGTPPLEHISAFLRQWLSPNCSLLTECYCCFFKKKLTKSLRTSQNCILIKTGYYCDEGRDFR